MNNTEEMQRITGFEIPASARRIENRVASLEREVQALMGRIERLDDINADHRLDQLQTRVIALENPTPDQPASREATCHDCDSAISGPSAFRDCIGTCSRPQPTADDAGKVSDEDLWAVILDRLEVCGSNGGQFKPTIIRRIQDLYASASSPRIDATDPAQVRVVKEAIDEGIHPFYCPWGAIEAALTALRDHLEGGK